MRVVCISDTHGEHWNIGKYGNPLPDGDVLVHTGDWQSYGRDGELEDFNQWLGTLSYKHKIVIAGNHDKAAWETYKEMTQAKFKNAIYLQDSEVILDGVKFYGMPWTPLFFDWYFMLPRGGEKLKRKCEQIPADTDVLLTHGPPMYKLDWSKFGSEHAGSEELRQRVDEIKPRYHVFGHVHAEHGGTQNADTIFINAAICDEKYIPRNKPQIFHIKRR